jgi:hypothetical protein
LDRQRPDAYKSSPLASDHDFTDLEQHPEQWEARTHWTQVLDLTVPVEELWRGVRKSFHSIVHRAQDRYEIVPAWTHPAIWDYQRVHADANGGPPRSQATYEHQWQWLADGQGLLMLAQDPERLGVAVAAAYWIVYQGSAYYASGPSVERSVQHAVIWESLIWLKANGVTLAELGQIDGETEKERNIGKFKAGFGGAAQPFTIARRIS